MKNILIVGLALYAAGMANAFPSLPVVSGGLALPPTEIVTSGATPHTDSLMRIDGRPLFATHAPVGRTDRLGSVKFRIWNANAGSLQLHYTGVKEVAGGIYGQTLNNDGGFAAHKRKAFHIGTVGAGGIKYSAHFGNSSDENAGMHGFTAGLSAEKAFGQHTTLGAQYLVGNNSATFGSISSAIGNGDIYLTHAITGNFSARVAIGGFGQDTSLFLGGDYRFTM